MLSYTLHLYEPNVLNDYIYIYVILYISDQKVTVIAHFVVYRGHAWPQLQKLIRAFFPKKKAVYTTTQSLLCSILLVKSMTTQRVAVHILNVKRNGSLGGSSHNTM